MSIKSRELEIIVDVPDQITLVYVEAVLMPNGEIICKGNIISKISKVGNVFRVPQK